MNPERALMKRENFDFGANWILDTVKLKQCVRSAGKISQETREKIEK